MRMLRGVLGSLLWLVAGLLGLMALILCVTVILLPFGIMLFRLSRTLFAKSARLMLPPAVAHPIKHAAKKSEKVKPDVSGIVDKATKKSRKLVRKQPKRPAVSL